jgi:hypothetical protein
MTLKFAKEIKIECNILRFAYSPGVMTKSEHNVQYVTQQ